MRTTLLTYLQSSQLQRRYLPLHPLRIGRVLTQVGLGAGVSFNVSQHVRAASLRYRSLALGEASVGRSVALLDQPHTKTYRLGFDARLYTLKSYKALRSRTQVQVCAARVVRTPSYAYGGMPYTAEFSA